MAIKEDYIPAVRWRMGEYQALLRLPDAAKARLRPLVILPAIEYDFETGEPESSPHDHAIKFVKRFKAKWKDRVALIDIDASLHAEKIGGKTFIEFVFAELRAAKTEAVPVVSLDYDTPAITELAEAAGIDGHGVCLRVRTEHLMSLNASARIVKLLGQVGTAAADVDFLVDLGAPTYEPYAAFAKGLTAAIGKVSDLDNFRSFAMLGTAFPESMPSGKGESNLKRHDWLFYKEFVKALPKGFRRPIFGDYTTVHPAFKADFDMRKIKPAGKVVYTTPDTWLVRKGGAFQKDRAQMHGHCDSIVNSGKFKGAGYSDGDSYIARCAKKEKDAGPSTLTKWKEVGISHHVMHVLEDVSKFGA